MYLFLRELFAKFTRIRKGKIFRNISVSLIGSVAGVLIGLLRTFVLLREISIDDFGIIILLQNFFTVLFLVFQLRVSEVLFKFLPKFEHGNLVHESAALMRICMFACLGTGVVLSAGVFFMADAIAVRMYGFFGMAELIRIYCAASILMPLNGYVFTIMRLYGRFSTIVYLQTAGKLISLVWTVVYLSTNDTYSLGPIVWSVIIGLALPVLVGLGCVIKDTSHIFIQSFSGYICLKPWRARIGSVLANSCTISWLKLSSDEGGLFLLGVWGAPADAVYWGVGKQLVMPIRMLTQNIQKVVAPEICKLYESASFDRLRSLILKSSIGLFVLSLVGTLAGAALVMPLLSAIAGGELEGAYYVVLLMIVTEAVTLPSLPFFSLAVSMDRLFMRNVTTSLRFVYLGVGVLTVYNAITLALVCLAGALTTRIFNDFPLFLRVWRRELAPKG